MKNRVADIFGRGQPQPCLEITGNYSLLLVTNLEINFSFIQEPFIALIYFLLTTLSVPLVSKIQVQFLKYQHDRPASGLADIYPVGL